MYLYKENTSLESLNTFGIAAQARYFSTFGSVKKLIKVLTISHLQKLPKLVLGDGSNILFTQDFKGLILKNEIKGYQIVKQNNTEVELKIGGGENWHQLVLYCVEQGWGGIENLSLIPGSVGAAPIQNIGAYGVALADVFQRLEWYDFHAKEIKVFAKYQCSFRYRSSIFKQTLQGKGAVLSLTIKLSKKPVLNITYGAIANTLKENNIVHPNIRDVSNAVIQVRQSKLPDPKVVGNCGSFFKNPEITQQKFSRLREKFKDIPSYPQDSGKIRVPAGWLIEQCGLKGYVRGRVATYEKQALVMINRNKASGKEVVELAKYIQQKVFEKFELTIVPEVNIL